MKAHLTLSFHNNLLKDVKSRKIGFAADIDYIKSNSQREVSMDPVSSGIELKWSIVAYKPSSSLSINLQLLCFMSKVWCWCGPIRHACSENV